MIIGVKCEGCGMWTRLSNANGEYDFGRYTLLHKLLTQEKYYYCEECESKIVWSEEKVSISFE